MENIEKLTGNIDEQLINEHATRKILSIGHTTLWNGVKSGRFPAPIKLGAGRMVRWLKSEVMAALAGFVAASRATV